LIYKKINVDFFSANFIKKKKGFKKLCYFEVTITDIIFIKVNINDFSI